LFVLLILAHERRRVVHIAVTDHPTAAWTAQQREALPWDEAPKYLVHDRDTVFHAWATTAPAIGIDEVVTAVRSPWQNAYAERLIGSIRDESIRSVARDVHDVCARGRTDATEFRACTHETSDAVVFGELCSALSRK